MIACGSPLIGTVEWPRNYPFGAEWQRRRRGEKIGACREPLTWSICEQFCHNEIQEATGPTKRATQDAQVTKRRWCWPRPERARERSKNALRLVGEGCNGNATGAPANVDRNARTRKAGAKYGGETVV